MDIQMRCELYEWNETGNYKKQEAVSQVRIPSPVLLFSIVSSGLCFLEIRLFYCD